MDADGSITGNLEREHPQIMISATNKQEVDVAHFTAVFGGGTNYDAGRDGHYVWAITARERIEYFMAYAGKHPLRSEKKQRLHLIPRYYELKELKAHQAPEGTLLRKAWLEFKMK